MDKDKLQQRAYEYLRTISPFKWHKLNDVPEEIFDEVWNVIDKGSFGDFRFGLHEQFSYLFMKTIKPKYQGNERD